MRLLKNKKGEYFITLVSIFILISLATMLVFIERNKDQAAKQGDIGKKANLLFQSYQLAEQDLYYIDMAAKYAAVDAYFLTAYSGALPEDSSCGKYYNFMIWDFENPDCLPMGPKKPMRYSFEEQMNNALENYFDLYENLTSPEDNYDVNIFEQDGKTIVSGEARNPINFDIIRYLVNATGYYGNLQPGYTTFTPINLPSAPASKSARDKVRKTYAKYGSLIHQYSLQYGVPQLEAVFGGQISHESGSDPYVIGHYAAEVGIAQFTCDTARQPRFLEIFGHVTCCGCSGYGSEPSGVCPSRYPNAGLRCSPSNDGRFNEQKSVNAMIKYVFDNYQEFKKMFEAEVGVGNANEETLIHCALLAYNRGMGGVKIDIRRAGGIKAVNVPGGWEKVARSRRIPSKWWWYSKSILQYAAIYQEFLSQGNDVELSGT